ncbi:MAG: DUF1592 domain-containing protein, partial [Rhizobiaceae bacterium]
MPDAALFADAAAGKLQTLSVVEAHARRLLTTTGGKARVA